jgi:prepilin-type N-terminal cleavage/methylation domain-containing protein
MNKFFIKKRIQRVDSQKAGFTLIEMLVAISILSLSILASFTAVSGSLKTSFISEDKITAYYLASEAVDFIRNTRDENGIRNIQALGSSGSVNWLSGIADSSSDPCYNRACIVDSLFKTIQACSGSHITCPNIKRDGVNKLYGYVSSWGDTTFKRSVTITRISNNEARVDVIVSWQTQETSKSYTLSEIIRDWQ